MSNSNKVKGESLRRNVEKAGAPQSAMTQKILTLNIKQRAKLLIESLVSFTRGRFANATLDNIIAALEPDLTSSAARSLGLTSSRVTLHFFRYKAMPFELAIIDHVVTSRGFHRIGGIEAVISVYQFPNSKLCLAIEADSKQKNITINFAGVGFMGKNPADFAAAGNFLKSEPGSRQFGDLLAHKHLATFAEMPGVAIELTDCSLQAIWEAVAKGK